LYCSGNSIGQVTIPEVKEEEVNSGAYPVSAAQGTVEECKLL